MFKKLFLIATTFAVSHASEDAHVKNYSLLFTQWMETHGFNFSEHEFLHRLQNFIQNDKFIEESNSNNYTYSLGHNQFSHMDENEFASSMLCGGIADFTSSNLRGAKFEHAYTMLDLESLPSSVDWRAKGVVNSIQDQGQCGSCYSFSTVCAMESGSAIKYGNLQKLSEQEIVDCSQPINHGCNGGTLDGTFRWVKNNGGLCTGSDYPYVSGTTRTESKCNSACKSAQHSAPVGWTDVTPNNKNSMLTALSLQPVSIAIEADTKSFQLYKEGIYTDSGCGTNLDHGVALVGYDTNQKYFILRNSWGTGWGEKGYMRIGMTDSGEGVCGLYMSPSYPTY